jgi:hypothetical protein
MQHSAQLCTNTVEIKFPFQLISCLEKGTFFLFKCSSDSPNAHLSCLWSANDTNHCILVIKTELQVFEVDSMHQILYPFTCHLTYKPSTVTIFCFICNVWEDPKNLQVPVRRH